MPSPLSGLWAVAHHDQSQTPLPGVLLQAGKGAAKQRQVLFRGQPADIQYDQFVFRDAPLLAQAVATPCRMKQLGIHAAPEQVQVMEATAGQFGVLEWTGHQGGLAAFMETAQVVHQQTFQ